MHIQLSYLIFNFLKEPESNSDTSENDSNSNTSEHESNSNASENEKTPSKNDKDIKKTNISPITKKITINVAIAVGTVALLVIILAAVIYLKSRSSPQIVPEINNDYEAYGA